MKSAVVSVFILLSCLCVAQDSSFVTVHVIYGSRPKAKGEGKWFGGKLGGHVGLEIAPNQVLHFNPGGKVKAFTGNSEPGRFSLSETESFYCTFGCDTVKRMSVRIPVPAEGQRRIDSLSASYISKAPYAYAFFGMRCAAACYHFISIGKAYPECSTGKMVRKFFYPRRLRKRLLRSAKKYGWEVTITEGTKRRKWDHD